MTWIMRDLKVRAWSKVEQKMLHVSSLHFIGDSTVKEIGTVELCCDSYLNDKSGMILMQYTSLKDKNGKEIYEGDVLRSKWGGTGNVVFDDGAFQSRWESGKVKYQLSASDIENRELEVIGNIYENPDFLN
jgi:uncharacterized phage protein (TIGR01671 family)